MKTATTTSAKKISTQALITVAASFLPLLVTGSIVVETIFGMLGGLFGGIEDRAAALVGGLVQLDGAGFHRGRGREPVAAEQAALRASVATMFVNLARRSQILVDRLIGHLDRLERGEEDPDRLAELFQLDHLATRMRRNAENLLLIHGNTELAQAFADHWERHRKHSQKR